MTILRRIRHALFASMAAFLLAILFVPTGEPRTVWTINDADAPPQLVIASGIASAPIHSPSRLPKLLTARLRWRLLMTQHYADQDINRQFRQAVDAVEAAGDEASTSSEAAMTLTSFRQPVEGQAEETQSSESPVDDDSPDAEASHFMTGHQFWTRQHERAAAAYDELLSLDKPAVTASPLTTLPGLPTRGGLLLAICCGLLGGLTMASVDAFAYRKQTPPESNLDATLHLPASWFRVRRTPPQRLAHGLRTACIAWIVVAGLLLATSARKEMGLQRLMNWPLAELADLV
ncbi:hypothetical protein CA51_15840 [Rosistilla oblonga]|uniref:hypothetical protein n=1 Tax=Rosistilla oblonga TaxID=2527990 RepID=UPI00118C74CC|nr:hypothetical protein [Rosistilla oblonga]QDV11709.1 hypothetical protein CA51_15840 [Rosistilla oblonga]